MGSQKLTSCLLLQVSVIIGQAPFSASSPSRFSLSVSPFGNPHRFRSSISRRVYIDLPLSLFVLSLREKDMGQLSFCQVDPPPSACEPTPTTARNKFFKWSGGSDQVLPDPFHFASSTSPLPMHRPRSDSNSRSDRCTVEKAFGMRSLSRLPA
jgi:hypothetical protein